MLVQHANLVLILKLFYYFLILILRQLFIHKSKVAASNLMASAKLITFLSPHYIEDYHQLSDFDSGDFTSIFYS
jgi:hypothetical protein